VDEHLTLVRQTAAGQRPIYWILGTGFVVGLAAHIGGFLLKTSTTTEPLALVADLLYALGRALWTSVIVVPFVQIWPEAKSVGTSRPSTPTRRRAIRPREVPAGGEWRIRFARAGFAGKLTLLEPGAGPTLRPPPCCSPSPSHSRQPPVVNRSEADHGANEESAH
jgi:hypothetical protein